MQIESRGFVYSSEVKNIHTKIVEFVRAKYNSNKRRKIDVRENLKQIKGDLTSYITKIIGREPMVMPMFVYINKDVAKMGKDDIPLEDAIVGMTLEEQ
ncbi:MAG: hypothetical protein GXP45_07090 [bacterium]|nr:hypothetical protein [bacterium]